MWKRLLVLLTMTLFLTGIFTSCLSKNEVKADETEQISEDDGGGEGDGGDD